MKQRIFSSVNNKDMDFKDRKSLIQYLNDNNFNYEYTYGFEYRNPTTNHVSKTKEEAIKIINDGGFMDVEKIDGNIIHINEFSSNDMW